MMQLIGGFAAPRVVEQDGIALLVYASVGGEKPLIVLHELPGMSPSFIDYCRRMADLGFKVHMPLLFMQPGRELGKLSLPAFCLSAEFRQLFWGTDKNGRPFTRWMLRLIDDVAANHPGQRIGIVGMCLTGGFALAGFAQPSVAAAIACQPSFPPAWIVGQPELLGLTQAQRAEARDGAARLPSPCAKVYRYAGDWFCRQVHVEGAARMLGPSLAPTMALPGNSHSTLTDTSADEQVFQDVLEFLSSRM